MILNLDSLTTKEQKDLRVCMNCGVVFYPAFNTFNADDHDDNCPSEQHEHCPNCHLA